MMMSSGSREQRRSIWSSPSRSGPWATPKRISSACGRAACSIRYSWMPRRVHPSLPSVMACSGPNTRAHCAGKRQARLALFSVSATEARITSPVCP
ncbi:hypothetical protein GBAR_LOCUS28009 [Geodia barretti]|uniref:Uncharacterized protein n=1 Tax=Geodia barretti TaxID=519541 RepID=A0AA35TMP9_GEOBA|nr:hypothetical protein GBAR_LOCUS28009 [Geodia barretti]